MLNTAAFYSNFSNQFHSEQNEKKNTYCLCIPSLKNAGIPLKEEKRAPRELERCCLGSPPECADILTRAQIN